jgi:hypothetical protein
LRARASCLELVPARAGEPLAVLLVGELGVRDPEPAAEFVMSTEFVEPPVGFGVDAGHEEARDARDIRRVTARIDEPHQSREVRLDHLPVAPERKDERHVDRDAAAIVSPIAISPAFVAGILT